MPRICIDCRYIRERPSGISPLVQALVDYTPRLLPEVEFLFLKHPKGPARLSTAPNARETVVRAEANGPATLLWLPRLVDLREVDVFHATFNILPAGLEMATVVTMCDLMWLKYPAWASDRGAWGYVQRAFFQNGIRRALRKATRLAAISDATRSEIGTVDPEAERRTRVTLLGVSEDFHVLSGPTREETLRKVREQHLPGARRYVLSVGQFAPYKNHTMVVRAFARAFANDPDVHLGLVQRLSYGTNTLRPLAAELGVADRVHFLSVVPFADLIALYNGALALCHPSLYEGFGNCPSEALACGCPVVTSNRSSMPEVSADAAIYVDPEDVTDVARGLRTVADDPALADEMRRKGLIRAKQLSWRAFAERNVEVYRELLQ